MYTALDPGTAEIRLLRVLSGSPAEDVTCEMQNFSLQDVDMPVYKALSYRWGDDPCEHEIRLNGEVTCVRKNLHSFLLQMQLEQRENWFFVDALCINQDDMEERAHQVSLMGKVYLGAEEVMAWIVREPYYLTEDGDVICYEEGDAPPADDEDDSLDELKRLVLQNSFWSRLWVVQEVLLAKRLTLRIGGAEIEWMNLLPQRDTPYNRVRYPKDMPTKNHMLTMVSRSYRMESAPTLLANRRVQLRRFTHHFRIRRWRSKSCQSGAPSTEPFAAEPTSRSTKPWTSSHYSNAAGRTTELLAYLVSPTVASLWTTLRRPWKSG
jgi:hypothetical protein